MTDFTNFRKSRAFLNASVREAVPQHEGRRPFAGAHLSAEAQAAWGHHPGHGPGFGSPRGRGVHVCSVQRQAVLQGVG
eukprot:scaffold169060_cov25-Prasinocladus_malaysianus.AAC.1